MRKIWFLLVCVLMLSGCVRSMSLNKSFTPYVPPTLEATPVNTPTVNPITPIPMAVELDCDPNLSYVDDVTVPDGTVYAPGAEIVKTWKVENSGTCKWGKQYSLRFIGGYAMGNGARQALDPIAPGEEGEITLVFTAPDTMGSYYSSWMAYNADGEPFGDEIYMEIVVDPYSTSGDDAESGL